MAGKDVSQETKESLKNIHITCMSSSRGLLWIGTNVGCVLTLPLPRLEGVPQIKGRPSISYHAHTKPVKFLVPIQCGLVQLPSEVPMMLESLEAESSAEQLTEERRGLAAFNGIAGVDSEDTRGFSMSDDVSRRASLSSSINKWLSTPDLRSSANAFQTEDDIHMLYGSLLRGLDEELDIEGMENPRRKRKSRSGLSIVSNNAQMLQSKISQTVAKFSAGTGPAAAQMPVTPKSKYATLPILMEDAPIYENVSMNNEGEFVPVEPNLDASIDSSSSGSYSQDAVQMRTKSTASSSQSSGSDGLVSADRPPVLDKLLAQNPHSKALLLFSGAEGHVNYSDLRHSGSRHEEVCLLLWQCQLT